MELVVAEPIDEAAQSLWAQLTASHVSGLVSVGVGRDSILVYVSTKRAVPKVPTTWRGFAVRVVETGRVRPAPSS